MRAWLLTRAEAGVESGLPQVGWNGSAAGLADELQHVHEVRHPGPCLGDVGGRDRVTDADVVGRPEARTGDKPRRRVPPGVPRSNRRWR